MALIEAGDFRFEVDEGWGKFARRYAHGRGDRRGG